jgi:hypothetical protein
MGIRSEAIILGMALKMMDEKMEETKSMSLECRASCHEAMLLALMDIVRDCANHLEKINERAIQSTSQISRRDETRPEGG